MWWRLMAGNDASSGSEPEMEDESCSGNAGGNEWWKIVNLKGRKQVVNDHLRIVERRKK